MNESEWTKSGRCDSSCCVEVTQRDGRVLVRDSKLGDQSMTIEYTPQKWAPLIERVKAGEEVDWDTEFFPLDFTEDEIDAFVRGVIAGEFDRAAS